MKAYYNEKGTLNILIFKNFKKMPIHLNLPLKIKKKINAVFILFTISSDFNNYNGEGRGHQAI